VFFEEHQLQGGLSQKIAAELSGPRENIRIHAVSNSAVNGSRQYLLASQGFDSQNISKVIFSL
jgi:transketolase C-terminal domain/subunit